MSEFNKLSRRKKCKFFATRRITVGKISQYVNGQFVDYFVGKIGGKIISRNDEYKFTNREDAINLALWFKKDCQKEINNAHD